MAYAEPVAGAQNSPQFYLATVRVIGDSNTRVRLQFDGVDYTSPKYYRKLTSYGPTVGDRVLVVKMSGTYIVLGRLS